MSSGIEFQNYQRAYDEIMAQLEAVQKGELEDWELEGARSTLLNNYATVGDSQTFIWDRLPQGSMRPRRTWPAPFRI